MLHCAVRLWQVKKTSHGEYTTGTIPKGTTIKLGIIGPQGWLYPGGSLQLITFSRGVQSIIKTHRPMNKFESPLQFDVEKNVAGIEISYFDLMEISQGGPEIGHISINGIPIQSHLFGGPYLNQGDNFLLYLKID